MNTVIFSVYDDGYRSSALLLSDGVDWGMIDKYMYKEQIPYADEIVDYDDEKLFDFFERMFNAEIKRIVIVVDIYIRAGIKQRMRNGLYVYE